MSKECKLCGGTGVIHVDLGYGMVFEACPNCNQAYREYMDELTGAKGYEKYYQNELQKKAVR